MESERNNWIIDEIKRVEKKLDAIIFKDKKINYGQLVEKIEKWDKTIEQNNIISGNVVAIISDYSPNAISLFLSLMKNNNIVVPLSVLVDENREFLEIAEVQFIFDFSSNEKWDLKKNNIEVKNDLTKTLINKKRAGLIIFSSGSTGKSKAILHDLEKLLYKFKYKKHKPLRSITFLLLDHIGGVDTLFDILLNGGTIIAIENRDPISVCQVIDKYKAELLPTTPTFLNLLILSKEYRNLDLSSLKIITYGAEPIMKNTLNQLNKILPSVRFLQKYGLSETGALRTKSKSDTSNWLKFTDDKFKIRIIDNKLFVKAETSMLGYLNASNPFDEDGYFPTGDIVEVEGEYIKIIGRESDIINVGGEKVFPLEVENVISEMPEVDDVIVYGRSNPIMGKIVVAEVKPSINITKNELRKRVRLYCRKKLFEYKIPVDVIIKDKLHYSPRLKKIRRKKEK